MQQSVFGGIAANSGQRNKDDRNRYNRRDGEDEPKGMGPLGKALLLILLIWACWAIYNFTGDRNEKAEEIVENGIQQERLNEDNYKWRYKDVTNAAGEYYLKEKGLFGTVIKIPMHHELLITGYCSDAAKVEMKFLYNIKNDLTIDELLYFHNNKETIEHGLKVAIRNTLIEHSVLDLFENNAADDIRKTANNYSKQFNLDVIFTTFTPEPRIQDALQRRADARAKVELEKQKAIQIKAEAERQIAIERAKQNMEEAVRRVKEAEKDKQLNNEQIKQDVIDSMNNVLRLKVDSLISSQLSRVEVPKVIISDGPSVLGANQSLKLLEAYGLKQPEKSRTRLTIEKTIEYLKEQANKI